jgi:hypothetical protein
MTDKLDDALTVCCCFLFPVFCVLLGLQCSSVHEVNFVVFFDLSGQTVTVPKLYGYGAL